MTCMRLEEDRSILHLMIPQHNHLLAALPQSDFEQLKSHLKLVSLSLGEALYESACTAPRLFPPSIRSYRCCTSWRWRLRPKSLWSATTASSVFLSSWAVKPRQAERSCRVPATPSAWKAGLLKAEFVRAGAMQHLLLRYTQALLTQMAQTAVCIAIIRWTSSSAAGCS